MSITAFNALGDPHRRSIVELLAAGSRSVREIADTLPISRPAVSRHLRVLKEAGLVVEEAVGTQRIYRLHDEGVVSVRQYLARVWGDSTVDDQPPAAANSAYSRSANPVTAGGSTCFGLET